MPPKRKHHRRQPYLLSRMPAQYEQYRQPTRCHRRRRRRVEAFVNSSAELPTVARDTRLGIRQLSVPWRKKETGTPRHQTLALSRPPPWPTAQSWEPSAELTAASRGEKFANVSPTVGMCLSLPLVSTGDALLYSSVASSGEPNHNIQDSTCELVDKTEVDYGLQSKETLDP